jgi:uncharacterized protein (DUF1684 family)
MSDLHEFRNAKDQFFLEDQNSPLDQEQRRDFKGLNYYPENPDLRFIIEVIPFQEQKEVQIQTSSGEVDRYLRHGKFKFFVGGEEAELTLFMSADGHPFLPFVDATSPDETYGAGRYLEVEFLDNNRYLVDFNLAYNPWCAYSPYYSCPLPPDENCLKVSIRAGEKNYS